MTTTQYRARSTLIEAWKIEADVDLPAWVNEAILADEITWCVESDNIYVDTPDGRVPSEFGDWLIRTGDHEVRLCRPDVFAALYEPVVDFLADRDELAAHCRVADASIAKLSGLLINIMARLADVLVDNEQFMQIDAMCVEAGFLAPNRAVPQAAGEVAQPEAEISAEKAAFSQEAVVRALGNPCDCGEKRQDKDDHLPECPLFDLAEELKRSGQCARPPVGWSCSRGYGHEGPCAAQADAPVVEPVALPEATLRIRRAETHHMKPLGMEVLVNGKPVAFLSFDAPFDAARAARPLGDGL